MKQRDSSAGLIVAIRRLRKEGRKVSLLDRTSAVFLSVCLLLGPITRWSVAQPVSAQAQAVSLGVLEFVDESGANSQAISKLADAVSQSTT